MCDDSGNLVLLNIFHNGTRKIRMIFHNNRIVWSNEKTSTDQQTLPLENVISIQKEYLKTHPADNKQIDPCSFTIHYASKAEKSAKWVYKNLTLKHSDPMQVALWVKSLQKCLESFQKRPKHILMFVNPYGGKRNAMEIYEKHGKQLFAIAEIEVTVQVSQRKDQIKDFVMNHNLDKFDAVGCVGGDGTVSELFNGLVLRECFLKGLDADDIKQTLPKPSLPVGIIPGGSTDTIAYCLHGTTDPTTAVLHIIFGNSLGLDLVSVYDESGLLRLYASVLSYGYLGDVAYHSDQYRWMGPRRYDFSGFTKLVRNKGYYGEISIYTESPRVKEVICQENCQVCESGKNLEDTKGMECEWQTITGKFFMVSGANISCACSRSPKGIAPYSHLGDGTVHLVLVKHTSILNNLKLLLRLSSAQATVEDLPFVETFSAREFSFRAVRDSGKWNCDGEVQQQSNIRAKVQCQLLTIFSRGNMSTIPSKSASCGF